MNLKAELLAAINAAAAVVPTPVELGYGFPKVYVRQRTVGEVDEQTEMASDWVKAHSLTATCAIVLCDEDGKLLFDPGVPEDLVAIQTFTKMPWEISQKILRAVEARDKPKGN